MELYYSSNHDLGSSSEVVTRLIQVYYKSRLVQIIVKKIYIDQIDFIMEMLNEVDDNSTINFLFIWLPKSSQISMFVCGDERTV